MDQWTRQVRATAFFQATLGPIIQRIFHFTYERVPLEGSYLLLANHNTDYDPIFMGMAAGPLRYVASEHIMRKGLGTWFLQYFFAPITIEKGALALRTTRDMFRALKDGKPVCLFPEGNRSFNGRTGHIPAVTGKLVQTCRVPVVTYRLTGGYLTQPRWGTSLRKGKMTGSVVNIYTPEALKKMAPDAITEMIRRDLYVDAYESKAEPIPFRGKKPALGLETALFCCPSCHKFSTLESDAHHLFCSCGFHADFDEFGYLKSSDQSFTLTELDYFQREELEKKLSEAKTGEEILLFADQVVVQEIRPDHSVVHESTGLLEVFTDHFCFARKKYSFDLIRGAAVHSRNGLTIHFGPESTHYEIMGAPFWNALKYVYLYRLMNDQVLF